MDEYDDISIYSDDRSSSIIGMVLAPYLSLPVSFISQNEVKKLVKLLCVSLAVVVDCYCRYNFSSLQQT